MSSNASLLPRLVGVTKAAVGGDDGDGVQLCRPRRPITPIVFGGTSRALFIPSRVGFPRVRLWKIHEDGAIARCRNAEFKAPI